MSPLAPWSRLLRFKDASGRTLLGEPVDAELDVGLASFAGSSFSANIYSGTSILDLDVKPTGEVVEVATVLCPLVASEVGSIRCIGLNVSSSSTFLHFEIDTYTYSLHSTRSMRRRPTFPCRKS